MYLAGIGATKQAQLFPEALEILNKSDDLMRKAANGIELTTKEQKMLDIWNGFIDAGFGDPKSLTALQLADMPESLQKYFRGEKQLKTAKDFLVDGLPYLNNKMNNTMDTMARLATFIEGTRNTKFLERLGVDSAGEAVRKVLFDPTDLTDFERNVMKRALPFYTFTKKNLAFQFENLSKNGSQYKKLIDLKSLNGLSLYFAMQSMAPQKFVIFHLFHTLSLHLLVSSRHIARSWLTFLFCFSAFQNYIFPWHKFLSFPITLFIKQHKKI